jgi:hypothetical protein
MSQNDHILSHVEKIIANALADGRLSREESEMIKKAIYANKKVTPEEAKLWTDLQNQVYEGEILLD